MLTGRCKVGIIGAGAIAHKMAETLRDMQEAELYAIAARDLRRAEQFAATYQAAKAYGSYEELADDPEVDLAYIATPHSHHYEQAKMCILKGKPVLCEKAFTANARQAETLVRLAEEKRVFLAEAIWTRYMPFSQTIRELVESGIIGKARMLQANLGYAIEHVERVVRPELCGGALYDLGVYPLNFSMMTFGEEIEKVASSCVKNDLGVDMQDSITLTYKDGCMAVLYATACCATDRCGVISGDKGYIWVENINNPRRAVVYDKDYQEIARHECPPQITGYEYEVAASCEALRKGWIESPYMPHAKTLALMRLLDSLRSEWGVVYPGD